METITNTTEQNSPMNVALQSQPSQSPESILESQLYREVEGVAIPEIIQSDGQAAEIYAAAYLEFLPKNQMPEEMINQIRFLRESRDSGDKRKIFLGMCYEAGREAARREYLTPKFPYASEPLVDSGLRGIGEVRGHMDLTAIMGRIEKGKMKLV